jgi:formylglycine-generating enzyme required for sulfatase activity
MATHFFGKGIERSGVSGSYTYSTIAGRENKPVGLVAFWDAARFANWLHNGQPTGLQDASTTEEGAYTLTPSGIAANSVTRNAGAQFALPSEDEWYKAAYYKGGGTNAGYWLYPTTSDSTPIKEFPPGGNNSVTQSATGFTDVGAYLSTTSPYGLFDMGGNAREWTEGIYGTFDARSARGGTWGTNSLEMRSVERSPFTTTGHFPSSSFRVVWLIPEPSSLLLLAIASGIVGASRTRKRRCGCQ